MKLKNSSIIAIILIVFGVTARLLPHPANIAPIGAIALFAGLYLPRRYAILIPFAAMILSDAVIGFYDWKILLTVYASFFVSVYIGQYVQKRKNLIMIVGGTVFASIIFYLTTNGAVWAFGDMYAHTFSGLIQSYTMALPFFRHSVIGDLFFVSILAGSMELLSVYSRRVQWSKQSV